MPGVSAISYIFINQRLGRVFQTQTYYFFVDLKPHTKLQNLTITPSEKKVSVGEKRREKKRDKTPLIVDT